MTPRVRAVRVSYDRRTPVSITHGARLVPRQFRVPEKARVLRVSNRPHAAYRVIPLVAAAIDHRRNAEKTSLPRETSLIGLARRERRFAPLTSHFIAAAFVVNFRHAAAAAFHPRPDFTSALPRRLPSAARVSLLPALPSIRAETLRRVEEALAGFP